MKNQKAQKPKRNSNMTSKYAKLLWKRHVKSCVAWRSDVKRNSTPTCWSIRGQKWQLRWSTEALPFSRPLYSSPSLITLSQESTSPAPNLNTNFSKPTCQWFSHKKLEPWHLPPRAKVEKVSALFLKHATMSIISKKWCFSRWTH